MSDRVAERLGMTVVNYIVGEDNERPLSNTDYPDGPVPTVSFFPSGDIGVVGGTNLEDLLHIE